jgi:hypothetical protein
MSSELPPSGEPHIPLHAEDLTVSKLTVAGDMVRVRTVTREHETFVDEALNHERGADRTKTDWPSGRSHSAARSAGRRYDNTSGGGRNPRHRAPPYSERRSSYPATNTGKNRGGEHCEARSAGRGIGAHMGRRFVHTAPPRRATARGCFPPPRTLARTANQTETVAGSAAITTQLMSLGVLLWRNSEPTGRLLAYGCISRRSISARDGCH